MLAAETGRLSDVTPSHIPAHLVVDQDIFDIPGVEAGPHEPWLRVRDRSPRIFWTPQNDGHWVVTRHNDVEEVLGDHQRFSSYPNGIPAAMLAGPYPQPPTGVNPPEHGEYRRLIMAGLSPVAVQKMEGFVREVTIGLIEELRSRGQCEFVDDFAQRMPISIFLHLMGLPEIDRKRLLGYAHNRMRGATLADRVAGLQGLRDYADAVIRDRRESPRDDLASRVANGLIGGAPMPMDQARTMLVILMLAGLDTVVNTLSLIARFLAVHPGHRRQLIEHPEIIPQAADEFLRRFSVPNIPRCVAIDQTFRGVEMRAGDMVMAIVGLTGLDEEVYDNPFDVDFSRNIKQHVGFGAGVHRCVGLHLARVEIRTFLEAWLARIPDFSLHPQRPWKAAGGMVMGLSELSLVWDPVPKRDLG